MKRAVLMPIITNHGHASLEYCPALAAVPIWPAMVAITTSISSFFDLSIHPRFQGKKIIHRLVSLCIFLGHPADLRNHSYSRKRQLTVFMPWNSVNNSHGSNYDEIWFLLHSSRHYEPRAIMVVDVRENKGSVYLKTTFSGFAGNFCVSCL